MCRTIRPQPRAGPKAGPAPGDEAGVVLLMVILVLALISVLILSWAQEWRLELRLAANFREAQQCRRLAEAGVYYALGKVTSAKMAEAQATTGVLGSQGLSGSSGDLWRADQRPRLVELPAGQAEVRVADEGGKLNLNVAPVEVLARLFLALGFAEPQTLVMAESISDWRSEGEQASPYGAKSAYYLGLDPPYAAKNGNFEVAEELAWVHGFEGSPLIPRLADYLTAQTSGQGVNVNTAPLEVLVALGFPANVAAAIMASRQEMTLRSLQDIAQLANIPLMEQYALMTFQASPFFTIRSTGMINRKGARHTIKAMVRLEASQSNPWEIIYWMDDFPG